MRRPIRLSLEARFNLVGLSAIALMAIGTAVFLTQHVSADSREALLARSRALAETVAQASPHALYTRDAAAIASLADLLAAHPEVAYVRFLDEAGAPLAARTSRGSPPIPEVPRGESIGSGATRARELVDPEGGRYLDVLVPVKSLSERTRGALLPRLEPGARLPRVLGHLQLGVRDRRAASRLGGFLESAAAFSLALAIGAAALVVLATRRFARPVRELAAVTRDIAGGNFEQTVETSSQDEVGALARALNVMLERLRDYRSQVEDHQRTLEAQVEERTLELRQRTEEAYELAHQAEEASRAKSQFLANMSHEIRTPMNGVLGMTELLLETKLSAKQQRFANTVHHSAQLLLGVISDILDFSRAEVGKLQLELRAFNLRDAVEDVGELLAEQAQQKGLELAYFVDDDVPGWIHADPVRIRQILTNLVGNSIKFTEQGEVLLRVTDVTEPVESLAEGEEVLRRTLEFTVVDTGIGIPPSQRDRIFHSFTQADGSMARRFGGTGLGLAICRQLVELMEGEIGFESEEGRGSRFWFRIPVTVLGGEDLDSLATQRDLAGTRVLIVDDNATNRSVLMHHLSSWGAEATEAEDGPAALGQFERAASRGQPFELVVLDMMMPGMTGVEVARAIREKASLPQPQLVVLTSVGSHLTTKEEEEVGVAVRLTKPTRKAELYRAFVDALNARAGRSEAAAADEAKPGRDPVRFHARVLLAEDNEVNQQVAVAILESLGCRVDAVDDGQQAIDRLQAESFDLIFMDCQMPQMDGFAATRTIRAREAVAQGSPRTPIVALTAHAMRTDRQQCLDAGMDDYVSKPFTREDLRRVLERWTPEAAVDAAGGDEDRGRVATTGAEPTLDESVLETLHTLEAGGDAGLVSRVVEAYLGSSTQLLDAARRAREAGDPQAMARSMHTLKSSSAQLGARKLSLLCKELEARGRADSLDGAEELLEQIAAELDEVHEGLAVERFGVRRE